MNLQRTKQELQSNQAKTSLQTISSTGLFKQTNEQAWEGTNIQTALRHHPEETRATVVTLINKTVQFIDAKKTLHSFEDMALCAETIFEVFPVLKLEELRLICERMKQGYYGNFFERLKIQEFRDCIIKHEEERASILEQQHKTISRGAQDPTNVPEYDPEQAKLEWRMKNNPFLIPGKNDSSKGESKA
jgi:predicted ribosome quality control (RQC) complex YloA/Tae2 family protein